MLPVLPPLAHRKGPKGHCCSTLELPLITLCGILFPHGRGGVVAGNSAVGEEGRDQEVQSSVWDQWRWESGGTQMQGVRQAVQGQLLCLVQVCVAQSGSGFIKDQAGRHPETWSLARASAPVLGPEMAQDTGSQGSAPRARLGTQARSKLGAGRGGLHLQWVSKGPEGWG